MCRMFAYIGDSQKELQSLYDALIKASEHDVHITWSKNKQHKDGWGCVILTDNRIFHYRNQNPIFEDDYNLPKINGLTYAIFHSRRKSHANSPEGSPVLSQPFATETDKEIIFLAHNGGLKIDPERPHVVDSERVLRKIVERGSLEKARTELEADSETALNLLMLKINRTTKQPEIEYLNSWKLKDRDAYYQLYETKTKSGKAILSSTLKENISSESILCKRDKILIL